MKLLNTNTRKELIFLTMRERRDALLKSWNESGILDGLMYDEDLGKVNIEQMLETSIMLIRPRKKKYTSALLAYSICKMTTK